ncbi:MAG: ABC-type transporter, ATPase subunit [Parachlamydiales bacterium]|nr:ABC-type transporter, ATPase subunit [Parachlamydiales bacterium]
MNEALIDIRHISKTFPLQKTAAIKEINAQIPASRIIGIVGPDGAGKTTLIRLIASLLTPSSGSIQIAGFDTMKESEQIHTLAGYMPQRFGLYEDLSVMQNLNLYADLRGVVGDERKSAFEKLLHFTNLQPFTNRLAGNLSGGMKQKLGLACALVKKPQLLLLDEPSVGVDPISRRELWKMVNDLLTEQITVLWSTVYLDEAERCHSVLLLNQGELLYQGPPQDLTQKMNGRVFKIACADGNRRQILAKALQDPHIIDGVIQGEDIRLVFRDADSASFDHYPLKKTEPRFEDAFIDILGGGPGGESMLANRTHEVAAKIEYPVRAEGLTKKFGSFTAADQITFAARRGEIFGLLGPNGAGKSTTFKMLCGLLPPTNGKAFVNDLNVASAPAQARSHIGYMAQKFSLYGNLSVKQNLSFFSGIYNLSKTDQKKAIDEMVEIFMLAPYLHASADSLPLGFKQRLSLACATMHHPEVLYLDEPTSGVDPYMRREFWNHINGLVQKGVTVLVSTHFMDEAEYCDRIALIYRGKIIQLDTPDALKKTARSEHNENPTLEDAFIQRIEKYDSEHSI